MINITGTSQALRPKASATPEGSKPIIGPETKPRPCAASIKVMAAKAPDRIASSRCKVGLSWYMFCAAPTYPSKIAWLMMPASSVGFSAADKVLWGAKVPHTMNVTAASATFCCP